MRWYKERQALKQQRSNRLSSAAKAQSILASLNGSFGIEQSARADVSEEAELADFDRKIYAAQQTMENAMIAELKNLGVPFFGTDRGLIVPDESTFTKEKPPEDRPKWSPVVTECQLLELRRRMVNHLEDLYRD